MAKHRRVTSSGQDSAVYLHLKEKGHSFEDSNQSLRKKPIRTPSECSWSIAISRGDTFPGELQFPSFYQSISTELFEIDGIVRLLRHFGWKWVGLIVSDDDTGYRASKVLKEEIESDGGCVAFISVMVESNTRENTVENDIYKMTANVIVMFLSSANIELYLQVFWGGVMPQKVWILPSFFTGETMIRNDEGEKTFNGAFSFSPDLGEIKSLHQFFFFINPYPYRDDVLMSVVRWVLFSCNAELKEPPRGHLNDRCSRLKFGLKAQYEAYPAIYMIAQSLHELYQRNQTKTRPEMLEQFNFTYWQCPAFQRSNRKRDGCVPKYEKFLSHEEPLGTSLASAALILSLMCVVILGIFIKYRETPIVRANNQYLSCLLLISLMLSFLCTLLFIGRPTQTCCLLRQVTFGIVFTTSVSTVLVKTLTVIIAFNAAKPGSKLKKYVGTQLAIILVIVCSLVGYMGALALLSFIAAFLAKDFPDRFNEAKNITFSMLIFCSMWGAFVPAYLSSTGTKVVAVEIFAILSSAAGLLGCVFFPKCYIIFLRSELNTRETLIRK
uniref:G-protein coupled receptors family 3 profile domain-containing protein n=1 Tax=Xenopus tropicalis TaxID=8364 RepID=A0A1B8YAQ3_XENTR